MSRFLRLVFEVAVLSLLSASLPAYADSQSRSDPQKKAEAELQRLLDLRRDLENIPIDEREKEPHNG
ncbi:MAG: hypothetical protein H0V76_07635, partial [Blastocatellia bacterium]|nr:hypothetical protein [Blastocatellia bacterium]